MSGEHPIDTAIEKITKLRIQAVKDHNDTLEQKLYEIEMVLFKAYDRVVGVVENFDFKFERKKAKLTLRQVEELTGISNAYLSQLENGKIKKPSHDTVTKLHNLYNS